MNFKLCHVIKAAVDWSNNQALFFRSTMINIEIFDDTIDSAALSRQIEAQVAKVKTMVANVASNDDEYRRLYIEICMVPQFTNCNYICNSDIKLIFYFWIFHEEPYFKVEVYVSKLNTQNDGRIRARFYVYDEENSDFSDYQRITDPGYEEESTLEADH